MILIGMKLDQVEISVEMEIHMEIYTNNKAILIRKEYHKVYYFMSTDLLKLHISYLQIDLNYNLPARNKINKFYRREACQFLRYAAIEVRKTAIESYLYAKKNNFPFFHYEATMNYTVTLNAACKLSTYIDQYQYTGGAHGNTLRSSSNWNLNTGFSLKLENIFYEGENFVPLILDQIIRLAKEQVDQNPEIYFDNYKELIVNNFKPNNFYLTPIGITIFYQQYEIGPYSSGIIEFHIPYNDLGLPYPRCLPVL